VLNLFNSPLEPGTQLRQISEFAEQVRSKTPDCERDLIVYYVGHGYFAGYDHQFYVAVASMDQAVPDATGLRVASLGDVLKPYAKSFRIYYVLDCCFAGEALKALQAGGEGPAVKAKEALKVEAPQARSESPRRGSALLCATSKDDFAMAPSDLGCTVFTDALIGALRDGDSELGERLTLAQLAEVVWHRIRTKHRNAPDYQVRPVVHAPDQRDGDVSTHVALFPNPAWRRRSEPRPTIKPEREQNAPAPDPGLAFRPRPDVPPPVTGERAKPLVSPKISTGKRPLWMRAVERVLLVLLMGACLLMFLAENGKDSSAIRNAGQQSSDGSLLGTSVQSASHGSLLGTAVPPGSHEPSLGTAVQQNGKGASAQPQHTPPSHTGGHH
jgi:hypothetical protein